MVYFEWLQLTSLEQFIFPSLIIRTLCQLFKQWETGDCTFIQHAEGGIAFCCYIIGHRLGHQELLIIKIEMLQEVTPNGRNPKKFMPS